MSSQTLKEIFEQKLRERSDAHHPRLLEAAKPAATVSTVGESKKASKKFSGPITIVASYADYQSITSKEERTYYSMVRAAALENLKGKVRRLEFGEFEVKADVTPKNLLSFFKELSISLAGEDDPDFDTDNNHQFNFVFSITQGE